MSIKTELMFNDDGLADEVNIKVIPRTVLGNGDMLIGITKTGEKIYMSQGSWDCEWYFGYGYIQTYEKGQHVSHSHFNGINEGKNQNIRDAIIEMFTDGKMTMTSKGLWEFCDYMLSFYALKEASAFYHQGGSHMTTTPLQEDMKKPLQEEAINHDTSIVIIESQKILLPAKFVSEIKNNPFTKVK